MSREKKSKVDDVVKLRKILDNSSDPNIKTLISTDEKALNSVRKRLAGNTLKTEPYYDHSFRKFDSLEPRVTVHPKYTVSPRLMTPPPKFKQSTTLPEFKSISSSTHARLIPSQELPFTTQELYEVEKVDVILPEPEPVYDSNLPEWQPVEETQPGEPPKIPTKSEIDQIPEFERIDIPITSERTKKVADWEIVNLILVDSHSNYLYYPYDGGADIIVTSSAERDSYKKSTKPGYLTAKMDFDSLKLSGDVEAGSYFSVTVNIDE